MGKIESYIGFAVKSNKIIYGIDNIEKAKKKVYLLVLSFTASENLREQAQRFSERKNVPIVETVVPLEDIVFKSNCKIIALTDENMAKAVRENNGR